MRTKTDTLDKILREAKKEFMEQGFEDASLRNICKSVNITTGAFYGYFKSKEELFDKLVGEQYKTMLNILNKGFTDFENLDDEDKIKQIFKISEKAMFDLLYYAYDNLDEFRLLLLKAKGTKYVNLVDDFIRKETNTIQLYVNALENIYKVKHNVDKNLEHVLIVGIYTAYFEFIIHDMELKTAEEYLKNLINFYMAGWSKLLKGLQQ